MWTILVKTTRQKIQGEKMTFAHVLGAFGFALGVVVRLIVALSIYAALMIPVVLLRPGPFESSLMLFIWVITAMAIAGALARPSVR
jgi:hypothetical protein